MKLNYDTFGIEEARELRELMSRGGDLYLDINCLNITDEAQNAMLKILEETSAKITLIHPSPSSLLPTLLSRVSQGFFEIAKSNSQAQLGELIDKAYNEESRDWARLEFLHKANLASSNGTPDRIINDLCLIPSQN